MPPSGRFTNWRKRFWKAEQAASGVSGEAGGVPASSFRREQRPFLPADLTIEERDALLVQMWQALTDGCRVVPLGCWCFHVAGSMVKAANPRGHTRCAPGHCALDL